MLAEVKAYQSHLYQHYWRRRSRRFAVFVVLLLAAGVTLTVSFGNLEINAAQAQRIKRGQNSKEAEGTSPANEARRRREAEPAGNSKESKSSTDAKDQKSSWKDKSLQLYFLTTRLNEGSKSEPIFSTNRHLDFGNGSLEYGAATLTKPPGLTRPANAQNGNFYRESLRQASELWWKAPVSKVNSFDEEEFFRKVKTWPNRICVYVHGYYKPFNQSLQDAAMLFSDYQYYEDEEQKRMMPIVFSWPSAEGRSRYSVDEANLEWSYKSFEQFMNRLLKEKHPDASIDIVTHSMGARLPIAYIIRDHADLAKPWFRSIYLCNADVDLHSALDLIKTLEEAVSNTVYVFVSDRDMPLVMSQYLHGQPRLGRPIDPPRSDQEDSNKKRDEVSPDLTQQFAIEAASAFTGIGFANSPDVVAWLKSNPHLSKELGERSRFIDVTNLVTANMGHGLPWSILSGMLADKGKFPQLLVHQVYKKPDRTSLQESFGKPRVLYRFTRLDPN